MAIAGITSPALADFRCSSDVSYKWKKSESEEAVIHWAALDAEGVDEAASKSTLEERVLHEKKKASEACKDLHENLSGCLGAKYSSTASELKALDFSARKALQDAIQTDCKAQQGRCMEISASDAKCVEKKKAESAEDTKKDDKGKGKGKDKKK